MSEHQTLSPKKVDRLRNAYRALLRTPEFRGISGSRSELIAYAQDIMIYAEQTGNKLPHNAGQKKVEFANALHALVLEFKGDRKLSIDDVIVMRTQFLKELFSSLNEKAELTEAEPPVHNGSHIEQLSARSRNSGLRQGSDDPEHPERSLNNFMNDIRGLLLPVIDVYERLDYAMTTPGGDKHKFFGTTSKAALRFDSQKDAKNAMKLLDKLIGEDGKQSFNEMIEVAVNSGVIAEFRKQLGDDHISMFDALAHQNNREILYSLVDESTKADLDEVFRNSMTIESEVISHKIYYWLKVPSAKAGEVSKVVTSLSNERAHVESLFNAGIVNRDTSEAELARDKLLQRIENVTLGDSHVAQEMARRLFATKETAR